MRVADLLTDKQMRLHLRTNTPAEKLMRSVTWCAPTEHMDPTPYLGVNALVLTTGMGLNFSDPRTWDAYVERLAAVPVSALAFGLGPAHLSLPQGLVDACNSHGIPLIELPAEVPFALFMRHVWQILSTERYDEQRSGWELADECTRWAAAGASLGKVLEGVAAAVKTRVAILDEQGYELISAGTIQGTATRSVLRLPSGPGHRFQLLVQGLPSDTLLQPLLGPVAAVLAMQLSYTLGAQSPLHSAPAAAFIEAIYAGSEPNNALRSLAGATGLEPDIPFEAVVLAGPSGTEESGTTLLRAVGWRLRVALERTHGSVRFAEEPGLLSILLQQPSEGVDAAEICRPLLPTDAAFALCITPPTDLPELPLTLRLARRHNTIPGVHRSPALDLTGIIDGLPSAGLVSMAAKLLAPLDTDMGNVLRDTLTAYLRHSGNARLTGEELFIHRNTLAYRIQRIETLLGVDLADGEVRALCLLSLRLTETTSK
ncbi:hypothetical protein CQ018_05940 [Arthrobacter sp. MYb227]|uniref:PucR family transcriptional regulator n=1 Tax=Arthrobacter sp. MYb227 TaxID=1848601 RepID=UPI000CFB9214|nr:PucR family transcriptional regulator [Arthrobacter sp. MYb227]PQZ94880.1 hypothetical protein CQ018_05940 [Arthrobacter sp. MYb227]